MNEICKRTVLFCGTGGLLLAGWRAVPLMKSVQIGNMQDAVTAEAILPEAPQESAAELLPEQPAETGVYTKPVLLAPPAEPDPDALSCIIDRESDGSKAMWYARPYQSGETGSGGEIVDRHFMPQNGTMFFSLPGGGQVRNSTFWTNEQLLAESSIPPDLPLKTDGTPMVLIYHTHTTESYMLEKTGRYDDSFSFRTTEPDKNMVKIGDRIAEQLAARGIGAVHAREIHDYPVWGGSYRNSAETIRQMLAEYPGICIALDIHRDAISDGKTVIAPVAEINGKQAAQIMIISGCDDGTMNMPDYRRNFHFASRLQQTAESMFPGFTRPILFDYRKYNQDLTAGSLLIEVGSQGNTLEEAGYAGELIGRALAETICTLADAQKGDSSDE